MSEDFRQLMREAFSKRRQKDSRLTLTKFAAELGMSPQKLNSILNQNAGLSTESAKRAAKGMGLDETQADHFVDLVDSVHHRSALVRVEAKQRLESRQRAVIVDQLSAEEFRPVSDWESIAAYVLVETEGFRPDFDWAAGRLGLTAERTQKIYERLFELGFLRIEGDRWLCDSYSLRVEASEPVDHLRGYHLQMSRQAVDFLERNPPGVRHFGSSILPVAEEELGFIRDEIEAFHGSLIKKLNERVGTRERLCVVNLQCFPIDRRGEI